MLNEQQQKVVDHTNGPLLVLACPGSGKTRCITERITRLLDEDVNPNNILAVTFTNKAANEMAKRIKEKGYGHKLQISTFHSLCVNILRKHCNILGYKQNFSICDDSAQKSLLNRLIKEKELDQKTWKYNYKHFISLIERKKNNGISDEEFELHLENEQIEILREYQKTLKASNTMDFGDLICNTNLLFEKEKNIRDQYAKRFQHILVDEMQDTNKSQLELIKHLSSYHNNIIAVGDICQSIYGWRGACIDNTENFSKHFKDAKTTHLSINYRSTSEILTIAEKLIKNNKGDLKTNLIASRGSSTFKPTYKEYKDPETEAEGIAELIQNNKWNGYNYNEMAILCRTNTLTRVFEECFRRKEIPYTLIGTFGFYDRKEIKQVISFLKFISNKDDVLSFEEIINLPPRGVGPTTLVKLLEHAKENKLSFIEACKNAQNIKGVRANSITNLQNFIKIIEKFDSRDPYYSICNILDESGFINHLKHTDQIKNENREENVLEFLRSLNNYCRKSLKPSIAQYLQEIMLITSADQNTSDDAIKIMTCHAAKGLEFDIIFIPGLEEEILPHKKSIAENTIAEERRVCYVAVTRAKDKLYLTRSITRETTTLPSRFLIEMNFINKDEWNHLLNI